MVQWIKYEKTFLTEKNPFDILKDPSRIFNGDETSFRLCPKPRKVLAPLGYRNVYCILKGNEKETITVLLVFSASGHTVAPISFHMCEHRDVVNSLPENWFSVKSEAGGKISNTFFKFIAYGVHSWLNEHNIQRSI